VSSVALSLEALTEAGELPREFCLFKAGTTRTLKGDLIYSGRSAKACAEFSSSRGIECVIDWEHASLAAKEAKDPAESGKAAGWFSVSARADGVYAAKVSWTPRATAALKAREYRYFSPVVLYDEETREITGIVNAALTNNPATLEQAPLVASAALTASDLAAAKLLGTNLDDLARWKSKSVASAALTAAEQAVLDELSPKALEWMRLWGNDPRDFARKKAAGAIFR
jgi:hypothetical protein